MIDSMEQEDFDIRNQQPVTSRERDFENALRPLNFEDFSGQKAGHLWLQRAQEKAGKA